MTEGKKKKKYAKCPDCKMELTYLNVPRTQFTIDDDGKPDYKTIKNQFNCPFCGYGIAGNEDLAIDRLRTGRFGYTTKQFEKLLGIKGLMRKQK